MIIELTGIPGSGKSTILKILKSKLKDPNYIFDTQLFFLGYNVNIFVYDIFLLLNLFKLDSKDWNLLKTIVKLVLKSNNKLFNKINLLRNSYKKVVINKLLQNSEKIFFVDEGLSHIPFNIFVNENINLSDADLKEFLQILKIDNKILLIDADDKTLLERVFSRGQEGHRRMDFSDELKVEKFMKQSRKVLESLKKSYNYDLFVNDGKDIDVKEIIKELEMK